MKYNYITKNLHYYVLCHFYKYYSKKNKVFGIGLNKTGTTSLNIFLRNFDYFSSWSTPPVEKCKLLLTNDAALYKEAEKFDLHEDWPWPMVYKKIASQYPSSKFILTLRDSPEEWFNSLQNTSAKHGRSQHKKLFYGTDDLGKMDKGPLIDFYLNHEADVITFFNEKGQDRLLIIKTSDKNKESKICAFLDLSNTNGYEYPYGNIGKY
jgi:sulfotransferase family protein